MRNPSKKDRENSIAKMSNDIHDSEMHSVQRMIQKTRKNRNFVMLKVICYIVEKHVKYTNKSLNNSTHELLINKLKATNY